MIPLIFPLYDMQYFQMLHDRDYHHDIYILPTVKRLSHLTQHLAKYNRSEIALRRTTPDFLACLLSISNVLNINIQELFARNDVMATTISELPSKYSIDQCRNLITLEIGKLSKALEGYDHVEPIDYRNDIGKSICELFLLITQFNRQAEETDEQLITSWYWRLRDVKQKNIFHARIHTINLNIDPTYKSIITVMGT